MKVYISRLSESTILARNIAKNMKPPKLGMFLQYLVSNISIINSDFNSKFFDIF